MTDFAWLIEAPGPRYLAVRELPKMNFEFIWTPDHNKALRFFDAAQADAVMMGVRELNPDLFAFQRNLAPARPVEHGWLSTTEVAKATGQ